MSYNFAELNKVMDSWANDDTARLSLNGVKDNNIILCTGGTEMLKVAEDGFYVRGTKVPVDDKEAASVYNAFKEFLIWSRLHRD